MTIVAATGSKRYHRDESDEGEEKQQCTMQGKEEKQCEWKIYDSNFLTNFSLFLLWILSLMNQPLACKSAT